MEAYGGVTSPCASLTCPSCKEVRWLPLWSLRQYFKRGDRFTGHCVKCLGPKIRAGHKMWLTKNGLGKHIAPNGYVVISPNLIAESDLPMFLAMTTKNCKKVMEHRWNMAKFLGRALTSRECVDHMDGNKQNNDPSNLRIYVRGKNELGSVPGHGTYYHEWQIALKRIRELEAEIEKLRG